MAETAIPPQEAVPLKKSKLPLILGLVLATVGGGGGFYAAWSGLVFGPDAAQPTQQAEALPDIAFVPVDPLVITLPPGSRSKHLRFAAQLEVAAPYKSDVALLMPRILDLLNGYLRAVTVADLEDPAALVRLRAQALRRIQLVTGEGRVRDLLITEFVLN
jgi:flagellar protein FliL